MRITKTSAAILSLAAVIMFSGCGDNAAVTADSSAADSAATAAVTELQASEPAALPLLEEEPERFTFVQYPCTGGNLRIDGEDPWLFDFRYSAACGYGTGGVYRNAEMHYGLMGELSSNTLTYWFYDYSESGVTVKAAQLVNDRSEEDIIVKETPVTLDTKKLEQGLYYIKAELSDGSAASLAFYVGKKSVLFCTADNDKDSSELHVERRKQLYDMLELFDVKPGDSYETMRLTYPTYPYDESYRCDTDLWIDLSSEITESDWSEGRKLLAMYEWMSDNLAYDNYMAYTLDGRREALSADYTGTYAMYSTHVGVCWDFANVLITMCRAQKIPAVSIENDGATHMWVAVYIGEEWYEIDPTQDIPDTVEGEDISVITTNADTNPYSGYFTLITNGFADTQMLTINHMLWTAERDSNGYCLRRPKIEYTTDSTGKIVMIL